MPIRSAAYRAWLGYRGTWSFIGALSWTTAAVYFIRDVGMSPLELVLAGTALELAYFVFEIPTGVVADLYSRRLSMLVAAVVSGAAMILIGAVPSFVAVLIGMALWGFGWTFRSGAEDAWLADELGTDLIAPAYQRGAQVGRVAGLLGIGTAVALALVDLRLPFVVAGMTAWALAAAMAVAMPEHGFTRPARTARRIADVATTARQGAHLVKGSPVLLLVLGVFFFVGAWAEGFDRLWEAHLLLEVGLPQVAGLGDVAWFGIFGATTLVLSFLVSAPLVRRIEDMEGASLARLLLVLHGALMGCALGFALAGSLLLAGAAYLATTVVRDLTDPPMQTWLNQSVSDSSVRATVLSITSIAGSAGEWTGGPALGGVGNRWGVGTALAGGAMLLAPTLFLFARAVRHHGVDPELASAERGSG